MKYSTADFSEIDDLLNEWAAGKGVSWVRESKGWDVRTIFWPLGHGESVQLWIDPPVNGAATVHVCHNAKSGGQHKQSRSTFSGLRPMLDESLEAAALLVGKLR